eukprot:1146999-Pelagomonas_calceolata.AAC.3
MGKNDEALQDSKRYWRWSSGAQTLGMAFFSKYAGGGGFPPQMTQKRQKKGPRSATNSNHSPCHASTPATCTFSRKHPKHHQSALSEAGSKLHLTGMELVHDVIFTLCVSVVAPCVTRYMAGLNHCSPAMGQALPHCIASGQ